MTDGTSPETPKRQQPSAETIAHLRHQIEERVPDAEKIFEKSGTTPTNRELINAAGEQLRREMLSDYDPLTQTLNRLGYEKRKKLELEKAQSTNSPVTVVGIDLDDLKIINDTQGHKKGDLYIKAAADALRKVSRLTDLIARKGGDEFEILLTNTDEEGAQSWEQRLRTAFEESGVKASIGVVPTSPHDFEEAVKRADEKMYVEKRTKKRQNEHPNILQRVTRPVLRILRRAA